MSDKRVIRPVCLADAAAIAEVYRPFVIETSISFEIDPPSAADFSARIEDLTRQHPWYVATVDGVLAGYAYASPHRARAAYRFSVETSVYLAPRFQRRGIARQLYEVLFTELRARKFCQAYAGITLPNEASEGFHRQFGFNPVGVFPAIGFKFDRWHDVAWFHRPVIDDNAASSERAALPPT